MRDIAIAAIVFGSLPFILWRPQVGIMMWVWLSVMAPHRLAWGFAYGFGFLELVAVVTLVSALISKDLKRPPACLLVTAQFLFVIWVGVTTIFALYPEDAFEKWTTLMKTQLFAILIPMLFHRKEDVQRLLWVLVLSIAFYGTKGGLWVLLTGGENRVYGPAQSYIADNNALAAAIVMTIPLMRYLQLTTPSKYVRWALTAMILLCGVAVLGTYSRGAFLAAAAMIVFLWWKGQHKLTVLLFAVFAIPFALSVMPEKWHQRMDSIANYQQDTSANARLNSWATMYNLAKARPLVGGGFDAATPEVFARYAPNSLAPAQTAHSIYFQAVGEHGFVGLALYLLLLFALWATCSKVARCAGSRQDLAWARQLSRMMQVCLIGFAVGGAFLSLVNFDVPYYLVGIMAAALALVKRESGLPQPNLASDGMPRVSGRGEPAALPSKG